MKTIKQISEDLGVSKQSIQKRIAREPLHSRIQPYISTEQGTKFISIDGEKLIVEAFANRVCKNNMDMDAGGAMDKPMDSPGHVDTVLNVLQKEMDIKNTQIAGLLASNQELAAALENATASLQAAQALHAGTMQRLTGQEQPRGLFARIFKKHKE